MKPQAGRYTCMQAPDSHGNVPASRASPGGPTECANTLPSLSTTRP
jgi:hypothetical protein